MNTQKQQQEIIDFVDETFIDLELKKFIKEHLPEHLEELFKVFKENPNNDTGQQTILSYTMLKMVIRMHSFYKEGKLDSLNEIIEPNEK